MHASGLLCSDDTPLPLPVQDIAHTWLQLHQAGCPQQSLSGLRACLFRGLGLYTRALAAMLREAPAALFSGEDWCVAAESRGSTPKTQLPKNLQVCVL